MLNRKKYQKLQGFTWIELLVVMAIVGIISAIVLPSFLNTGKRCCKCTPEAQQYVGTLARAQQAYLLEEKHFASFIPELGKVIEPSSRNYTYSIENNKTHVFVFGKSQKSPLNSYVAGVFINPNEKNTSTAILCKAQKRGPQPIAPPIDANTCGAELTIRVLCSEIHMTLKPSKLLDRKRHKLYSSNVLSIILFGKNVI
jgi:type IV pilus assembly protein PilA